MSSIPYWCHDLPAAPLELGMGIRIPQSICDGSRVSQGIVTDLMGTHRAPGQPPTALMNFASTPNISTPSSDKGGEFEALLLFWLNCDTPKTLTRARSRDWVLTNTCDTKHDTGPSLGHSAHVPAQDCSSCLLEHCLSCCSPAPWHGAREHGARVINLPTERELTWELERRKSQQE